MLYGIMFSSTFHDMYIAEILIALLTVSRGTIFIKKPSADITQFDTKVSSTVYDR